MEPPALLLDEDSDSSDDESEIAPIGSALAESFESFLGNISKKGDFSRPVTPNSREANNFVSQVLAQEEIFHQNSGVVRGGDHFGAPNSRKHLFIAPHTVKNSKSGTCNTKFGEYRFVATNYSATRKFASFNSPKKIFLKN